MADDIFHLGWIHPDNRTAYMHDAHDAAMAAMPKFSLPPQGKPEVNTKLILPALWSHPRVIEAYGQAFTGNHQLTGSCVGVGGGNVIATLECIEILNLGQNERFVFPYFWFNYGVSRKLMGDDFEGEGSLGSTFARSFVEYGSPAMIGSKLPPPKDYSDGWVWGSQHEMRWSRFSNIDPAVGTEARPHVGTTAPLTSAEQVRDSILNGYPVTRASGVFVNPNSAQVRDGALIGNHNGQGGHQESWLGYWNHPQEGELIWEQNQWGLNVYGKDPGGGPLGGCWITMDTCQRMIDQQYSEVFAFSNYQGYPAQPNLYDWVNQSFWS
jgi:hypothetical protein